MNTLKEKPCYEDAIPEEIFDKTLRIVFTRGGGRSSWLEIARLLHWHGVSMRVFSSVADFLVERERKRGFIRYSKEEYRWVITDKAADPETGASWWGQAEAEEAKRQLARKREAA